LLVRRFGYGEAEASLFFLKNLNLRRLNVVMKNQVYVIDGIVYTSEEYEDWKRRREEGESD
jgi:hypothetical protein